MHTTLADFLSEWNVEFFKNDSEDLKWIFKTHANFQARFREPLRTFVVKFYDVKRKYGLVKTPVGFRTFEDRLKVPTELLSSN